MKLKWPGFNERGSVIIDLMPEYFCLKDSTVVLDGLAFNMKEELHVTLIRSELGLLLQDIINLNQKIRQKLRDTFEDIDWSFKQTGPVHILSRKKNNVLQGSIILLIEMPGMTEFYDQLKLSEIIDIETPVPPAHVTLYTYNCPFGIGVPSVQVLDELSVRTLSLNEFNALFKS